ncbi:aminotransferase class I/II-fold pyridoxal phosphate-dependent enzyme [Yinghuangia sp. ASG 101]|uniref:aminotransferase class I/II-fold pyridoxal phosphate-dependent enzyme n=1 Tax=Yinghuangia sp. ASG 101 TaxID=2896848 RepID=UPI001E3F1EB4|nr:aminotransferase class I/II-fold pyridoxal phosphate-dependent enzyme [Yinghuangia sp. ASG 101]UGQ12880.1 aminotransferase class I/II-fold pyridoxal phosphate-dependent enzyme [Yinghuangia sp. ASG 101]
MAPTGRTAADIAASVERDLHQGALAPGDALPPVRVLAAGLGVNPNTVAAAYRLLRERGIVETHGRAGTRVRPRPAASARSAHGPDVPPGTRVLASGEPDPDLLPAPMFPDPATWRTLYDHPALYPPLADAARTVFTRDGVPADHMVAASGALDAVERGLMAHLRPGDTVLVEDPGWANFLDLLAALNLNARPVRVDDDGPDPESVADGLRAGARAFVVTARAQNPRGAAVSAARAAELRSVLAARPDVFVIEDDHGNAIAGPELAPVAGDTAHWLYVRSSAKAYGPDLRCAVASGDATTVGRIAGRQRLGPGWVSHALQHAVAAAWTSESVAARIEHARTAYTERRAWLVDALARRGVTGYGRSGINVWVPVRDEVVAVAELLARGWLVAPGKRFRIDSGPAVRITVARLMRDEADALADAVAAVPDTPPSGRFRNTV